jgi:DNA-binding NtrC family response regulator
MNILLVEDHGFFGNEINEYFLRQKHTVAYASNYLDAVAKIKASAPFDFCFIDVLLQNGRTGIDIVNEFEPKLGRIMFITGCIDEDILKRISKYSSATKRQEIWPKIEKFMDGETVRISEY